MNTCAVWNHTGEILGFIRIEGIAEVTNWGQQIETSNREIKMLPLRQPPDKILDSFSTRLDQTCAQISHLIRWAIYSRAVKSVLPGPVEFVTNKGGNYRWSISQIRFHQWTTCFLAAGSLPPPDCLNGEQKTIGCARFIANPSRRVGVIL